MTSMIFGITGQDGQLLSKFLLKKGIDVVGITRGSPNASLSLDNKIKTEIINFLNLDEVISVIKKYKPTKIYNLAAQSSVGLSFSEPALTVKSNLIGALNILEAVKLLNFTNIKIFNASSSECFGDVGNTISNEFTPFKSHSPYGISKIAAHNLFITYRETFGLHASNGILFNHESYLRPHFYVTQKIVRAAYLASIGKIDLLKLGRIDIVRDWGWADDYVEAMALMLDKEYPSDYIISTGRSESLEYFLEKSFLEFNLDYKDFVIQDHNLFRPQDIKSSRGTPEKAKQHLGWVATHSIDDVIKKLCDSHQE